jgi:two-component system cell cycle response regulator
MFRSWLLVSTFVLWPLVVAGQTSADLLQRLPGQTGLERARTLAALTDALRQDKPRDAITYGQEALSLFAEFPDPENEIRTLNEMAWAYMTVSQYNNAIGFAEKGRARAEETGHAAGRARAINNLGVIAQRRGDAVTAVDYFTESLKAYRDLGGDLEVSTALNNLGFVYSTALADYETGLAYHVEALALREKSGDKSAIALSLNNIAIVYHRIGDLDRALNYLDRSLALRRELGGDNRISGTLSNIGDVYYDKGDLERAMAHYAESLALRRKIGDRAGIAASLRNLALIHSKQGNDRLANAELDESLEMAEIERTHGSPRQAIVQAREALQIMEKAGNLELQRQAWAQLAASQERAGDYASAVSSLKMFQQVNSRIFDAERTRRVELLERRYQVERRESEIAQLRAQQATAELTLARQQNQRNAAIGAAALFAAVGVVLYRRRVASGRTAQQLSVTDTLTGLKNRRYVLETIASDIAVSERKFLSALSGAAPLDADLVFFLVDIDHFKSVNEKLGHEAGDRVLVQLARALAKACRTADTLARWGGEEFLVIGRFTHRGAASVSAERLRRAVEGCTLDAGSGRTLHCTCSIGFASYPFLRHDRRALTWEQVVALADDGLYLAKAEGRNQWVGVVEGDGGVPPRLDRMAANGVQAWLASGHVRLETAGNRHSQPATEGDTRVTVVDSDLLANRRSRAHP